MTGPRLNRLLLVKVGHQHQVGKLRSAGLLSVKIPNVQVSVVKKKASDSKGDLPRSEWNSSIMSRRLFLEY